MSHNIPKLKYNKHQELLNDINNLFISIKLSKEIGVEYEKLKASHPIPENSDLDKMQHKIISAFSEFDVSYTTKSEKSGWGGIGG